MNVWKVLHSQPRGLEENWAVIGSSLLLYRPRLKPQTASSLLLLILWSLSFSESLQKCLVSTKTTQAFLRLRQSSLVDGMPAGHKSQLRIWMRASANQLDALILCRCFTIRYPCCTSGSPAPPYLLTVLRDKGRRHGCGCTQLRSAVSVRTRHCFHGRAPTGP